MNTQTILLALAVVGGALVTLDPATAQPAAKPKAADTAKPETRAYTDPAQAGPDFVDQGEYRNEWGGAQVIALGEGRFRLVVYRGGLPGAGWDGEFKTEVEGKREGEKIVFASTPDGFTHALGQGVLTTATPQGETYTMRKVTRSSPTLGAKPPAGALVLFDGSDTEAWAGGRTDGRGLLVAGTKTKRNFTNFTLHVEFQVPFKPLARGQGRGNSGVYLIDRYEVQVLDSFGLKGENNECGGIYKVAKPLVNMCLPPLSWQTYDIDFQAAKFNLDGSRARNAVVTVRHNGVVIHDRLELPGPTGGRKGRPDAPGGPIQLQAHGNPVFYRNVWLVEKSE